MDFEYRRLFRNAPTHVLSGAWALFPPEVHEDPAEVVGVLLHAVVERADLLLVEEAQHVLLQLPRPLAGDDLDHRGLDPDRLVDDLAQGAVDLFPAVVDLVQIELQLRAGHDFQAVAATWARWLLTIVTGLSEGIGIAA